MLGGRRGLTVVAVVTPVHGNRATLEALVERLDGALGGREWRLRLVVDASPDDSLAEARRLAAGDRRLAVTALGARVGQHGALTRGLAAEAGAGAWVCLDADLQDPPEAVPVLLDRLAEGGVVAVFGGRRGAYEGRGRRLGGHLHRAAMRRLTGLPADAGAFVAMSAGARDAVVDLRPPSIVAGIAATGLPTVSVPVERASRPSGRSAWTGRARARQSIRTLAWAAGPGRRARGGQGLAPPRSQRSTTTSA